MSICKNNYNFKLKDVEMMVKDLICNKFYNWEGVERVEIRLRKTNDFECEIGREFGMELHYYSKNDYIFKAIDGFDNIMNVLGASDINKKDHVKHVGSILDQIDSDKIALDNNEYAYRLKYRFKGSNTQRSPLRKKELTATIDALFNLENEYTVEDFDTFATIHKRAYIKVDDEIYFFENDETCKQYLSVLKGRCKENDNSIYKALDDLIID